MNLEEYDLCELRAIYAVLPPYFHLDNTPGHEHEKKQWREGFVKCLKDRMTREQMKRREATQTLDLRSSCGSKGAREVARNAAYFHPSGKQSSLFRANQRGRRRRKQSRKRWVCTRGRGEPPSEKASLSLLCAVQAQQNMVRPWLTACPPPPSFSSSPSPFPRLSPSRFSPPPLSPQRRQWRRRGPGGTSGPGWWRRTRRRFRV